MSQIAITIRPAEIGDAVAIEHVHDAAWREAYRGIMPGIELERTLARRGAAWWRSAIRRGARINVLDHQEKVAGYASYGRNRSPWLTQQAEIYELYLTPEFQGVGLGGRLFRATRAQIRHLGLKGLAVWALSDNDRALAFYSRLGGRVLRRSTGRFGKSLYESTAFGWD